MIPRIPRSLRLAVIAAVVLSASACTDMSEVVYDEITDANFKPKTSDLAALMAPAYIPLQAVWMGWHGLIDVTGEASDELVTPVRLPRGGWYDGGIYIRLHEHTWDGNLTQPRSLWTRVYGGVNAANRVIHQIESGQISLEPDVQTAVISELRAVRAYYYWLLLDHFGNVPVVTDFTDAELPEQRSRQEVYNFVVAELTAAAPGLSEATGTPTYARINKWAALALLARTYLNAGVYSGSPQWAKVVETTDQIINGGKYQLESTYRRPFSRDNGGSVENLWVVPYHETFTTCGNFHMKTLKPELRTVLNLAAQPWGGSSGAPQFIDTYEAGDGRLADSWLMGDHRDANGIGYTFVKHVPRMTAAEYWHGFPVWKYEIYASERGCSDVDYPVVRYAEVLLMKAEALLRTGQADAAAALVTQVRQRNFKGEHAAKAVVTGAQLQQGSRFNYGWYDTDGVVKTAAGGTPVTNGGADIQYGRMLDELGWEFPAEGHRRTDLIRFGVFTTKTWFNHKPNGSHRIIFPIPTNQLQTNPKLQQNPGY
jgi:hypothetical protein